MNGRDPAANWLVARAGSNGLGTRRRLAKARPPRPLTGSDLGDAIVGWVCCIGLAVLIIVELTGRLL